MDKKYLALVESLDIEDQHLLQEETRSDIWKKAYAFARKTAKKEIAKLEVQQTKKKDAIKRKAAQQKRRIDARALRALKKIKK